MASKSPTGTLVPANPSKPKPKKRPKLDYDPSRAPSVINFGENK